jgi:hypothetical protein
MPFAVVIVIVKAVPPPLHAMMTVGAKGEAKNELRLPAHSSLQPPTTPIMHWGSDDQMLTRQQFIG